MTYPGTQWASKKLKVIAQDTVAAIIAIITIILTLTIPARASF